MGHWHTRHQGVMGRSGMEMKNVEAIPQIGHHIHLNEFGRHRVTAVTGLPKGFRHRCKELCACAGVAAGKEHHVVTAAHQFFREVVHDPLRPPIATRWHALKQGRNLTDSHCATTDWIPPIKISAVTSGLVRLNSAGPTWSDLGRRRRSDLAGGRPPSIGPQFFNVLVHFKLPCAKDLVRWHPLGPWPGCWRCPLPRPGR